MHPFLLPTEPKHTIQGAHKAIYHDLWVPSRVAFLAVPYRDRNRDRCKNWYGNRDRSILKEFHSLNSLILTVPVSVPVFTRVPVTVPVPYKDRNKDRCKNWYGNKDR